MQFLYTSGDRTPVHALQMPPQRRPPSRESRRALDLADDGEDILVQKRLALLGQKLPALQQPVLQARQPLHLRRRDAILPRHPAKLSPVVPGPAQDLLARVLAPVEEPTACDKGPDAQQTGEDVRCFEGRKGSETCEGSERRKAYHQPPREVPSTFHADPPRSPRPEASLSPRSARPRWVRARAGPSGPPSSRAPARRPAALCRSRPPLSGARSRWCRVRRWPPPRRSPGG